VAWKSKRFIESLHAIASIAEYVKMGEITLALHPVTIKKLREEMVMYNLSYDDVLVRVFAHKQFNRLNEQLAVIDANRNRYYPSAAIGVDVTFDTQFYAQSALCQELLTSYSIASIAYPHLWTLLSQSDIESAIHASGLEFRLTRSTNYQQTIPTVIR
jgi:hypothetical protein